MPAQGQEPNVSDLNIQPLKESDAGTAPNILASQLQEDGYLVFRSVLDLDKVAAYRRDMTRKLTKHGVVVETDGEPIYTGTRIDDRDTIHEIRTSMETFRSLRELARSKELMDLLALVARRPVELLVPKNPRYQIPADVFLTTPMHHDIFFYPGVPSVLTAWMPLMDIDRSMGGLLLAAGTHKKDLGADLYQLEMPSRTPYLPDSVADDIWLRSDFHPGDVLIFMGRLAHKALPNVSNKVRLSVDCRYNPIGAPMDFTVMAKWRPRRTAGYFTDYKEKLMRPLVQSEGATGDLEERVLWRLTLRGAKPDRELVKSTIAEMRNTEGF